MRQPFLLQYPWEETTLCLVSDFHGNSPDFNNEAWEIDKQRIIDLNARILLGGDNDDWFTHFDPRFAAPRYTGENSNVLRSWINKFLNRFEGVIDRIDFVGVGNHEATFMKRCYVDPTHYIINEIEKRTGKAPIHGGYTGMFRVAFKKGNHSVGETWYYHHGAGGSAPVTKGMIDFSRLMREYWADVYWIQHKHNDISDQPMKTRLNSKLNYVRTKSLCVMSPGYNNKKHSIDYNKEGGYTLNWAEEKFYNSQPAGSSFITYKPYTNTKDCLSRQLLKFN